MNVILYPNISLYHYITNIILFQYSVSVYLKLLMSSISLIIIIIHILYHHISQHKISLNRNIINIQLILIIH